MKFKNILSLNIFMVFAVLAGSGEDKLRSSTLNYDKFCFVYPQRDKKDSDISPYNDPIPSAVGFYDGDMKEYKRKMIKCLQPSKINGAVLVEGCETKDDFLSLLIDHMVSHTIQDIVMQRLILKEMGDLKDLKNQRDNAYTSRNFYRTIACCGLNLLCTKKPLLIDDQILKDETAKARAQKYVQVKKSLGLMKFDSLIHDFIINEMSLQEPDAQNNFLDNQLSQTYDKIRERVAINYEISNLNRVR